MNFINQWSSFGVLISYNKVIKYLLFAICLFSKYAWVIPSKEKKLVTILNAFQKMLNNSKSKPNRIWVDEGSEFYDNSFKKWLNDNDIGMHSTHNEGKFVVAERFIRTLKKQDF